MAIAKILVYGITIAVAAIYGFKAARLRTDMEASLDWQQPGKEVLERALRDVVAECRKSNPQSPQVARYRRYNLLCIAAGGAFVIEVILLQH